MKMVAHSTRRGLGKSHSTKERSIAMRKGKILRKRRVKVLSALSELRARWARLGTMGVRRALAGFNRQGFFQTRHRPGFGVLRGADPATPRAGEPDGRGEAGRERR